MLHEVRSNFDAINKKQRFLIPHEVNCENFQTPTIFVLFDGIQKASTLIFRVVVEHNPFANFLTKGKLS